MRGDSLFSDHDLDDELRSALTRIATEVEGLDPDRLLTVSEADLIDRLTEKYRVEPLVLLRDQMSVDGPREADIDVTGDPRYISSTGGRVVVKGLAVTIIVPFQGHPSLFKLRPGTYDSAPPRGQINGQELHLVCEQTRPDAETLRKEYEDTLSRIQRYIQWGAERVKRHADDVRVAVQTAITQRKKKLLADRNMVASLGLPLRRRDTPDTYTVPAIRRKPKVELPKLASAPFKQEPELPDEEYEFILKVLANMALAMERSPRTFSHLHEEQIRDFFLIFLNGHYEGAAFGEAFNGEGKTDILIRHESQNLFIAECKFWRGDKGFTDTIDQLLGYTSWRDTKTAILIFNRNRNLTKVLEKIPGLVKAHPNYKRELPRPGETQFRYVLHHNGDRNRELILTVLVFDVPTTEPTPASDGATATDPPPGDEAAV